ncbi:hypothetical protein [Thiomicrorhabdus sediminis]|uniref:Uncharacterized protein n=1 Tax=Thiomicrorhabdus sediminis TaxID=2580412 RepID=A0A4P9K6X0_9GAMM|nr:hypothetical protein [Thiomicrorhabdus sediminis]QCU90631.1 hypothetical protein FE785_08275 [Thiomicrorhabdus sediminis]
MQNAGNLKVVLTGLPGCGISRLLSTWQLQFVDMPTASLQLAESVDKPGLYSWSFVDNGIVDFPVVQDDVHHACVIDVRSSPQALCWLPGLESLLLAQLQGADSIVFNFTEQSDLTLQAEWSSWLKKHGLNALPIVRVMNQQWPQDILTTFSKKQNAQKQLSHPWVGQQLQCLRFDVSQMVFDHLLMALDNSRHSLTMPILRVTANLNTLEYANRVRLEGSACRLDSFAADQTEPENYLKIYGFELNDEWFEQLIKAARY